MLIQSHRDLPASRRDHNGVTDEIRSMGEVDNFLSSGLVNDLLKVLGTNELRQSK